MVNNAILNHFSLMFLLIQQSWKLSGLLTPYISLVEELGKAKKMESMYFIFPFMCLYLRTRLKD